MLASRMAAPRCLRRHALHFALPSRAAGPARKFTISAVRHPRLRPGLRVSHQTRSAEGTIQEPQGDSPFVVEGGHGQVSTADGVDTRTHARRAPSNASDAATRPLQQQQQQQQSLEQKTQGDNVAKPKPGLERRLLSHRDLWQAQSVYFASSDSVRESSPPNARSLPLGKRTPSSTSQGTSAIHLSASVEPENSAATAFFTHNPATQLYSTLHLRQTPPNSAVPEIALVGASNVGKSTFLNALVSDRGVSVPSIHLSANARKAQKGHKGPELARTSANAGLTRTMNAYGVGPSVSDDPGKAGVIKARLKAGEEVPAHSLVVVDTPGYGFKSQSEWGEGVVGYLKRRAMLRGVVVLIAGEKGGVKQVDRQVLRMVAELGKEVLVVVTKGDKLLEGYRKKVAAEEKKMKQVKPQQQQQRRRQHRRGSDSEAPRQSAKKNQDVHSDGEGNGDAGLHEYVEAQMAGILAGARQACRGVKGGPAPRVYLTAADMKRDRESPPNEPVRGGNRGMAGVRAAMLDMVGLTPGPGGKAADPETEGFRPETRSERSDPGAWRGDTISFDELEELGRNASGERNVVTSKGYKGRGRGKGRSKATF